MFGIGGFELFLILLFGFLIFGPDKLPAAAKTLGKAIAKFRAAQEEMNHIIKSEIYDPSSDDSLKKTFDGAGQGESCSYSDKPRASRSVAATTSQTTSSPKPKLTPEQLYGIHSESEVKSVSDDCSNLDNVSKKCSASPESCLETDTLNKSALEEKKEGEEQ